MFSPCWQLPWALCTPAQEPRVGPFKLQHVPLVKKYLKFTIISIICLWNFWNHLIFKKVISLWAPIRQHLGVPVGCPGVSNVCTQGQPRVFNRSHWSKIIQNLLYLLFVFEIFEIAQKTKKLALSSCPLDSSQGRLCVPRHAQCGSVRFHKKFFQPQYI